ncbi:tetraacyldisaccharide 4'-kinase [Methylomonas sp. AM2-LC]|uniref:tetraacyldisaccharide 4'-kinase n=1 Tax=Methylomonas sp. AM2-LC TaxID=3153301 RepID=UPI003264E392
MKAKLVRWLTDAWYKEMYLSSAIMPLSMLYVDVIRFRHFLYRIGVLKSWRSPVPVIIVGNITVGGTGKTPLVIKLVELLTEQGYKPGVISRGYAGTANQIAQTVTAHSDTALVGDEAVLLASRCACPVVIAAKRVEAAQFLLANFDCNVIISDDGLQHYALQRDFEIVVIDGERRFGNGYCLPAGPLREPTERLKKVDWVLVNGGQDLQENETALYCRGDELVNLLSGERKPLTAFNNTACHAVAAIGNPARFFKQLSAAGLTITPHAFPDHYAYSASDLNFKQSLPIIMTEKDAVKCRPFAQAQHWYLPITADVSPLFTDPLLSSLKDKIHG